MRKRKVIAREARQPSLCILNRFYPRADNPHRRFMVVDLTRYMGLTGCYTFVGYTANTAVKFRTVSDPARIQV